MQVAAQLGLAVNVPEVAAQLGLAVNVTEAIQDQLKATAGPYKPIMLAEGPVPVGAWPVPVATCLPSWQSLANPTWPMLGMQPKFVFGDAYYQQLTSKDLAFSSDMSGEWDALAPGSARQIHWHTNTDEILYLDSGILNMTLVPYGGVPVSFTLQAGDIGWAPRGFAHSYLCVSIDACGALLMWNAGTPSTIDLGMWVAHSPPSVVASTLNVTEEQVNAMAPSMQTLLVVDASCNSSNLPWPLSKVLGLGKR
ncbi:hypothetical protein FOA52_007987 [Chlamydomonas sp. UWO 241]|nr:hypothetical protein FOA52_007987 [Chlamydomonas sp. UWO 241]